MSKLFDNASDLESAASQISDVLNALSLLFNNLECMGMTMNPGESEEDRACRLAFAFDREVPSIIFMARTLMDSCDPHIMNLDSIASDLYAENKKQKEGAAQ